MSSSRTCLASTRVALGLALLVGAGQVWAEEPNQAMVGELVIDELGVKSGLRIRVFHDPSFFGVPPSAGHLFLVAADSAIGSSS